MITRSEFAARFSFKERLARGLALAFVVFVALEANGQSPTVAPDSSSAARNLLVPSPPVSNGPSVTTNSVTAPAGYVLTANDQVAVEVFGEEDLRTNGRLNGEGNLSLPLLGSVHLSGLTLTQATSRVTELYARDYLVNPKVNVSLVSYAKRRFTVLGQVNRPGSFEMPEGSPGGIDLLEAVAMAGGYTRIAAPERITVRRHGPKGDEVLKVDGKRLARGAGTSDFKVLPGDTITVGESIF
ncbi:MAG TPA: polysaccharide biosynthesis/export family protein [Chthoniobacterales bacterium]|nr:polysaccharide biosynthesis/export family protein [Chthoniobacterales bacterium]